jgi:hypothetical protein
MSKTIEYKCLYCGKGKMEHQAKTGHCVLIKSNKYSVVWDDKHVYTPDYSKPLKDKFTL